MASQSASTAQGPQPLVSVVTTFLNAEQFLEEAINSVLDQTYSNWELLLVDDGSQDGSTEIARRYANRLPEKIQYLEHKGHRNRGMAASRNFAISGCNGEYVAPLDSDDVWLPHKLEQQVEILCAYPSAGMVHGASQYWYSWTGKRRDIRRDFIPELCVTSDTLVAPPELLVRCYPLGTFSSPCVASLMLRRALIERIGGWDESFRDMYEDQALLAKVYVHAPVFIACRCWDRYRVHPDSYCARLAAGQYDSVRFYFLRWLWEYLLRNGVQDERVWRSLKRALWPYQHPFLNHVAGPVMGLARRIRTRMRRKRTASAVPLPESGRLQSV